MLSVDYVVPTNVYFNICIQPCTGTKGRERPIMIYQEWQYIAELGSRPPNFVAITRCTKHKNAISLFIV